MAPLRGRLDQSVRLLLVVPVGHETNYGVDMERNLFSQYADDLMRLGVEGVGHAGLILGHEGKYDLWYTPFENVNRNAKLVIVGITPGNTQLEMAYKKSQDLLKAGLAEREILVEVKKAGAFGGKSMKPNLLKMLRHFRFEQLLGIVDVQTLWGADAALLHSTSVVPHAAFKDGERFNGGFDEVMATSLLRTCFLDCFVPSASEMRSNALFIALGPCPQAALEWCVREGALQREQVLGSFCHPSSAGGSTTRYYLREVTKNELDPKNPVRSRCDWLDSAYEQMYAATSSMLGVSSEVPVKTSNVAIFGSASPRAVRNNATTNKSVESPACSQTTTDTEIATILAEIERQGYRPTNTTSKLSEFRSPGDQTIYAVKTTSRLSGINFMVHPGLDPEVLRALDGVDSVDSEHRFHSNMTRFPKRTNKGRAETAYGWQIRVITQGDLSRFLSAFKSVGF